MRGHKERLEQFDRDCNERRIFVSDKKKEVVREWIENRKPKAYSSVNDLAKAQIKELFIENPKLDTVVLFGSYYAGDFINEETMPAYRVLREEVMNKTDKISDIDIATTQELNLPKGTIIQLAVVKSLKEVAGISIDRKTILSDVGLK
jgi:predicted nucleotidyltransferase